MDNGRINIDEILKKYFEGATAKSEVKIAEDFLLLHPGYMESFVDKWNLSLKPQEKEYFLEEILYKSFSDLSEEQMMLLAAAAAEGDLSTEDLSGLNESFNSVSSGKISVSDYKKLKLSPFDEGFRYKNRLLKTSPKSIVIRRNVFYALSAAAVIALFVLTAPLSKKAVNDINPATFIAGTVTGKPVITGKPVNKNEIKVSVSDKITRNVFTRPAIRESVAQTESAASKTETLTTIDIPEKQTSLPSLALTEDVRPVAVYANVITRDIKPVPVTEENWLIKGITGAVAKISNLRKNDNPFDIADQGIKGINKLLGWNMRLEKVAAANGEAEVIKFRSDLVGFSKPIKKKQ
jgi:hypothetical protein